MADPDPRSDFWRFYLHEHADATNRRLHLAGTTLALLWIVAAVALRRPGFLLAAAGSGYLLAWVGHLRFERNRPATFRFPLRSLASDARMWALWVLGRLGRELERHGVRTPPPTPPGPDAS